ncbi:hypothetical protein TNCT_710171 [Trichonephila clavata]|uniref:Uncharacterized protein n=1 Tax=Trichonephila clavata TaxID=2740835 RepID=A0A8X6H0J7_TRICU|nr:hypothetical protein TNCT_710171 [Trichonephila clavata]
MGNAGQRPGKDHRRATTFYENRYLTLTSRRHQNMKKLHFFNNILTRLPAPQFQHKQSQTSSKRIFLWREMLQETLLLSCSEVSDLAVRSDGLCWYLH